MEEEAGKRLRLLLVVALAAIIVGGSVDLVLDAPGSWLSPHVAFELLMIAGAVLLATSLWLGWWRAARSVRDLQRSLLLRQAERDAWQAHAHRALEGLGEAIDGQFANWGLTPAEREVALLLLKGYSHKRIASVTGRSERTARQHAATVYQKAGLGSRAELAAFFLEGLLLPGPLGSDRRPPETTGNHLDPSPEPGEIPGTRA